MSSRTLNRKDFLVLTVSSAAIASFLEACGTDDPATTPGTAGSGTGGGSGAGTGGSAGAATGGSSGSGTGGSAGSGTSGSAGSGTSGAGGSSGGAGGSGGSAGGGGKGGAGGGGGAGGAGGSGGGGGGGGGGGKAGSGGGGTGGGGGGMCGSVSIMQTSSEPHTHIPADATMLKADLKTLINGTMATMAFTLPKDGMGAGHTHTLTFTMAEVMMLKGGGMITGKKSSMDSQHDHTYTIGCSA